jgi:hypothetical protein
MALIFLFLVIPRPSKIFQNLDFWNENIPPGNPAQDSNKESAARLLQFRIC